MKTLLSSLLVIFIFSAFSYSESSKNKANKSTPRRDEWKVIKDTSDVQFSYRLEICDSKEVVLLKVKNQNANGKLVSWSIWNIGPKEQIVFAGNEEKVGSCSSDKFLIVPIPVGVSIGPKGPQLVINSIN